MTNNFLLIGLLAAFGAVFVLASLPATETARPSELHAAAADSSKATYAIAGPVLETRQAPVPLVRRVRPPPVASPFVEPAVDAQNADKEQADLDKKAAKAAVEADGYKRVTLLGKAGNGAWRAKGFRGTTEVLLTVDGTGRVSME